MKRFLCLFIAALSLAPLAQAQVLFDSGSARPNNPGAAKRAVDRQAAPSRARAHSSHVRCRDGSIHTPRVCKRHGGIRR